MMPWLLRMLTGLNPLGWPLAYRVPAVVVLLMLSVSVLVSDRVLVRLVETQKRHLSELSGAYLDGLSSAVLPHVLREDVWEVYDVLERAGQRYEGLDIAWTTVTGPDGLVLASSLPREFPLQSPLAETIRARSSPEVAASMDEDDGRFGLSRDLVYQNRVVGTIYAEVGIAALIEERWDVLKTLLVTNALLTLLLAIVGYAAVRRMLRPIDVLAEHMNTGVSGRVTPIPEHQLGQPRSEFGRLFRNYNSLVDSVAEREKLLSRLAEEERLAALGRLASGMAHEINNPLGGMLNALQTLKRHGERADVRVGSASLIERGLLGIRNVVRSTLATYRAGHDQQALSPAHLDDIAVLIRPELRRRGLQLDWHNGLDERLRVPAHAVRDATLNLLLNACAASPKGATIGFSAERRDGMLVVRVSDQGPGMPAPLCAFLEDRARAGLPVDQEGGLGLWIVKRLLFEARGRIEVEARPAGGSMITMWFPQGASALGSKVEQEFSDVA
ncbi:MAG: HAMP domain-containing protein [Rhizobiales bacterium]|nr:HAMP domain-containing protein [Hyphomicrobiales bacterium]